MRGKEYRPTSIREKLGTTLAKCLYSYTHPYTTKPAQFSRWLAGPRKPLTSELLDSPSSRCSVSDCGSVRILTHLTAHSGARTKHEPTRASPLPSGELATVTLLCLPSNRRRRRCPSAPRARSDARPPPLLESVVATLEADHTSTSAAMRLANVETLKLRLGDKEVIPYADLLHAWQDTDAVNSRARGPARRGRRRGAILRTAGRRGPCPVDSFSVSLPPLLPRRHQCPSRGL
jgi:hypothetical protein